MHIYIPHFGSLLAIETTQERIDNSLTGDIWVLTKPVIEVLAVCLSMGELKIDAPELLLGLPYGEAIEKLWETAHALYIRQFDIDRKVEVFRYNNHHLKSAMFELGLIPVEDLLAKS